MAINFPESFVGLGYKYKKDFPNSLTNVTPYDTRDRTGKANYPSEYADGYFTKNPELFRISPKSQPFDYIKFAKTKFYVQNEFSRYTSEIIFDDDVQCIVFVNQPDKTKRQCNCVQIQKPTGGEGAAPAEALQGGAAPVESVPMVISPNPNVQASR